MDVMPYFMWQTRGRTFSGQTYKSIGRNHLPLNPAGRRFHQSVVLRRVPPPESTFAWQRDDPQAKLPQGLPRRATHPAGGV